MCPRQRAHYRPFEGYDVHQIVRSEYTGSVTCLQKAIKKGHRYVYFSKNNIIYSGPAVYSWFQKNPEKKYCTSTIFTQYDREYGTRCRNSCQKPFFSNSGGVFYSVQYMSYYSTLNLTLEANGVTFFEKQYDILETNDDPIDKRYKVEMGPRGLFVGLQYNDCKSSKQVSPIYGGCASYISEQAPEQGHGHVITFTYLFRSPEALKLLPGHTQIKVRGEYVFIFGEQKKVFTKYITVKHASKPVIKLEKRVGICEKAVKEIVAQVQISERSFSDRGTFVYKWQKVIPATVNEKEKYEDVSTLKQIYTEKEKLIIFNASSIHRGTYEFMVETPFGKSYARTTLEVYSGTYYAHFWGALHYCSNALPIAQQVW